MSSRSVPTQTDKVKFSGSSVDHEAGELEVRVVQWPDTGAHSLCSAAITILCCSATTAIFCIALTTTICPLWCQQCTRGVAHCSNTDLYLLPTHPFATLGKCLLEQYMSAKYSLNFYLVLKMHVYCVLIIMFLPKCVKYMRFCFCFIPWRLWSAILFISPPPTVIVNYDWGAPITSPTTIITEQHCRHTACKH